MADDYEMGPIPRLDGALRRSVAEELWRKWRFDDFGMAALVGISGVGKSQGVVRPLRDWAQNRGTPTAWVDVQVATTSIDSTLLADIAAELEAGGHTALASTTMKSATLVSALRSLLKEGALVVVDEFQRLLDQQGEPSEPMVRLLEQLARRPADAGCLLLVSNRNLDWSRWTESLHIARLPPPSDDDDAVQIVLQQVDEGAATKFPLARRLEVVHRLGRNPRVLRLLGNLLDSRLLDDLLPPVVTDPAVPVDPRLIEGIERELLAKAAEGLPEATRAFLSDLSVVRDWAPWALVEEMGGAGTDVRERVDAASERFLLQVRGSDDPVPAGSGGHYRVHPLLREVDRVHLRKQGDAWKAVNRRAGEWYARKLRAAGRTAVHDRTLQFGLDGAWHHFTAAGADAELLAVVGPVHQYLGKLYGAGRPRSEAESDARIALLEVYNAHWGSSRTCYQLAVLLRDRSAPGDLEQAVGYAKRGTSGEEDSAPWGLWIKLVRMVDGAEAAVGAAREAAERVAPNKSLYSVYQFLGTYLNEIGRTRESVASLREGIDRVQGGRARLAVAAVWYAAAQTTDDLLVELISWMSPDSQGLRVQLILAQAVLHERRNQWSDALVVLAGGRLQNPAFIDFVMHEALCHLSLGDATAAQRSLDQFGEIRHESMSGNTWCVAFVALEVGRIAAVAALLGTYLGETVALLTPVQIRELLLREWDKISSRYGTPGPSLMFPVLPPTLTGTSGVVIRPQFGGPVLPQHQSEALVVAPDRLHVLALATAWSPTSGGVNTFNRQLCVSLARIAQVTCVVLAATDEERREADAKGVVLVVAPVVPGASDNERLSDQLPLPEGVAPDVIIGHGRWTGPAARRLGRDYRSAKRAHVLHVIPDDIERHKPKEGVDTAALAEERQEIELALGAGADRVVAVGPRIHDWFSWDLARRRVDVAKLTRFDPGFDFDDDSRQPPQGRWTVLVTGRMEDYSLKGLDLAARAFNAMRRKRVPGAEPVELLVRGAPPDGSTALEEQIRKWAEDPSLPVRVRPYTTRADVLAADLRGASLVLMPSRAEGFGLVAAEAIVAGTPVLVTAESGLGQLLRALEPEEARRIVVPVTGDDEIDVPTWSAMIEGALRSRGAEFRAVAELRGRLAAKLTWAGAAAQLLEDVCGTGSGLSDDRGASTR